MSNKEFDRKDVDRYLYEVAKLYKKQNRNTNAEAEIIIVGGAAMLLRYNFRDTTMDIDAVIRASSSFKDAVNCVGDTFGLPNGWINSEFRKTVSYSDKLIEHSKYYKKFCNVLSVRLIEAEYLLAMKMISARLYKKDMSDIVGIIKEHEELGTPITFEKIDFAVHELYGGWDKIDSGVINYVKTVLECDDLESLYYDIVDEEKLNRKILIEADEKYPDAMNNDNAESFLMSFKKKSGSERESVIDKLRQNQERVSGAISENVNVKENREQQK